jgi:hypothetical protein
MMFAFGNSGVIVASFEATEGARARIAASLPDAECR